MTRRRFYAPVESFDALESPRRVTLAADEARHLRDVLRLRAGDEAYVFDGEGREYLCAVAEGGGGRTGALLEVRERVEPQRPESPLELTLGVALLKGEKFDWFVQKATELGASRIVPLLTKRADVRLRDARDAERRALRWQRLALEAAKQSGRARVPSVAEPRALESVLAGEGADGESLRLLFAERGGRGLSDCLPELTAGSTMRRPASAVALVGPEGGWEDAELAQASDDGWSLVTLGGRTLRAETAAVAVAVLLQHLLGDIV
ncbi:MAG TPA: 16S rRNA (uracil(1498)-N(3))-methyltransferase [Pyrinomonadaceae bacterium]|jgi:16S rRNA (uracil1498-N3)-methyltransferase|nr:16S rRNA (uracil(1498)-N(3))-methyltransferase [Pyrinomonadaceae bacterium]